MILDLTPQQWNFIAAALREFPAIIAKTSEEVLAEMAKQAAAATPPTEPQEWHPTSICHFQRHRTLQS